jgi:hypothetical protein
MANAQGTLITNASAVLDNTTPKGIQVLNPWIRDYPDLMYVGLELSNFYADGGKLKRGQLTYAEQKTIAFKNIGALESDLTIRPNEIVWYEASAYTEKATIIADATSSATVRIAPAETRYFKKDDVVIIIPGPGSTTTRTQVTISAVDATNGTLTFTTNVSVKQKDTVMFAYNLIEHGRKIERESHDEDVTPITVYFQKFGGSVKFDSQEINQSRFFVDAVNYVKSKFSKVINRSNNAFAHAWYYGRNIPGAKSEMQGLETVIQEREAKFGTGSTIIDFSGITTAKEKAKKLVETLNLASTAPVYTGTEVPTIFCNYEFINSLSEIMYDMSNHFTLKEDEIIFGLTKYSSPYFKNVSFIVSKTLCHFEPNKSVAYIFPKHLCTFRYPENSTVNEAGALVKTNPTGYSILKMPQTSVDIVEYTAQITLASIFAGQSYANAYQKITNF